MPSDLNRCLVTSSERSISILRQASSITDHVETLALRVFGRVTHAKIEGKAGYKNSGKPAFT